MSILAGQEPDPFEDPASVRPPVTEATYTSECAGCDGAIYPGDLIRYDELNAGWTGVDCCGEDDA